MGLIHFHVRHYAMAVRFFQHALTFDQTAAESAGKKPTLHAIGASRRPEILYNLGIALLHLKRPKDAFDCFLVPLSIYHNNPRLWLRLAETCIMVHTEVTIFFGIIMQFHVYTNASNSIRFLPAGDEIASAHSSSFISHWLGTSSQIRSTPNSTKI